MSLRAPHFANSLGALARTKREEAATAARLTRARALLHEAAQELLPLLTTQEAHGPQIRKAWACAIDAEDLVRQVVAGAAH